MPANARQTILIVDPEEDFLSWAKGHLSAPSVAIDTATNAEAALKRFEARRHDVVVIELRIGPFDGLELLKRVRHLEPNAMVLLTTAFPPTSAVIEAMKLGAYDFCEKRR